MKLFEQLHENYYHYSIIDHPCYLLDSNLSYRFATREIEPRLVSISCCSKSTNENSFPCLLILVFDLK